mmetsp:Transcript_35585/g.60286  ORF Transcript_35585/g.60286 Transcript_35585/m.60286 type:complete len:117 (-) Transcript_35585:240-590(-)
MPRTGKIRRKVHRDSSADIPIDLEIDFIPRDNPKPNFHAEGFQFTVINPEWIVPIRTARSRPSIPAAENKRCVLHLLKARQLDKEKENMCWSYEPKVRSRGSCYLLFDLLCCCWGS